MANPPPVGEWSLSALTRAQGGNLWARSPDGRRIPAPLRQAGDRPGAYRVNRSCDWIYTMTEDEMMIRARAAVQAMWARAAVQAMWAGGEDDSIVVQTALRALRDLDKPVPDPDEEWREALDAFYATASAFGSKSATPLDTGDRRNIAGLKAARSLMPKE